MKALVCKEPGRFEWIEKERPAQAPGRAIIKVWRIGICGTDLHAFEGTQPYFSYPRILGHELSGELVDIEPAIEGFEVGEPVSFIPYFPCHECIACKHGKPNCCRNINGFGVHIDGGMMEYVSVPAYALVHGNGLSFDELALVEPLAIGAHAVRIACVGEGDHVLVTGAGPIGLGVMEMAKLAGGRVIAVDTIDSKLEFCKNTLGIDHTLKPGKDALVQVEAITEGDFPAIVIDATGNKKAIMDGFQFVAHGGTYVMVGLQGDQICFSHPDFHKRENILKSSRNATREDFEYVVRALKSGRLKASSYITHRVSFEKLPEMFKSWLEPGSGIIKAMVEL